MRPIFFVALLIGFVYADFDPTKCLETLQDCRSQENLTLPTSENPTYDGYSADACYYCSQTMTYVPQLAQTFCLTPNTLPDNYVNTLTSLVCDIFNDDPDCVNTVTDVSVFAWSQWKRRVHCDPCACLPDWLDDEIKILKLLKKYCDTCSGVLPWLGVPWCPQPVDFCTICETAGCPPATTCLAHAPLCL